MNTHILFHSFNSTIKLVDSKRKKLKNNRNVLRKKIKEHFREKEWEDPKFYSQGSFPLNTNVNPIKEQTRDGSIKEKYDIDDGVYFVCPESERKEATTYHDRIKKAVDGHASKAIDKNTCVRVVYSDGHHIDLPSYWLENDSDTPQLAHKSKGFIESDPKPFKEWVDSKISSTTQVGQLRRIIRYLKAWKEYRESQNSNLKVPSGFILTILACNNLIENERDDLAIKETVEAIESSLISNFSSYRPTVPIFEDLLEDYNKDTILDELKKFVENAQKAIDSDCEKEASEYWRKLFGNRFPLGKKKDYANSDVSISERSNSEKTKIIAPWALS